MNGILIGSFLICVSTDSVVSAEEVPTEILSEPVNDARDSKDKLIEVLNKENELTENPEAVAEEIEVNNPSAETPEQSESIELPVEFTDAKTNVDTEVEESESGAVTEESSEAGVSNEENTGDTTEEPVITEPEVPTEEETPGDGTEPGTGNEGTDNDGDTSTPEQPGDENNEPTEGNSDGNDSGTDNDDNENLTPPSSEIDNLDDKVKDAFKPIEMPEEDTKVEKPTNNTTSQNNDTSRQKSQTNTTHKDKKKKITKYNIDRLPETGITDNIELIYIFEIVILGFALLLLSFKPVRKSHKK